MSTSVRNETVWPAVASRWPRWRSAAIIALVALIAMAPELLIGLTITDNYRFNLLWPEQFGELFRSGNLYPRWLPDAWKGLGTPAFYFYPPVFFWVTSAVDAATGGALPSQRFVPIGTTLVLIASGLAMFSWLRAHASERRALMGAAAYMVAPYHLYDIYCRGALAEAAAYVSVPIIMLALARLAEGRTRYMTLLAISYAALLMTHLPSALLVSVLLIPAYVLWSARSTPRPIPFLAQALAGGLLGIALAAVYLLPALTLLPFVNPGSLTRAFYRPETWFFWSFPSGTHGIRMMLFIIPLSLSAALLAGAALVDRKSREGRGWALLWAALIVVVVVLVAGLFPPFWKLPGLAMVQFPSRALLIVEFAAITLLATTRRSFRSLFMIGGALLVGFAYFSLGLMVRHTIGRTAAEQSLTISQIRSSYLDAPEYLPAGVKVKEGAGPDDVDVELAKVPIASASDPRATVAVAQKGNGSMTVVVDSPAATQVALRRYYFPHWRIYDGRAASVPVVSDPRERVVSFEAPAGKSVFQLELGTAPNEILGRIVSLLALVALGGLAFGALRRSTAA